MGATGWKYCISYEPDINAALQNLRQQVFRNKSFDTLGGLGEMGEALLKMNPEAGRYFMDQLQALKPAVKNDTKSIEELLEECGSSGTHSILDITHVSDTPEFASLSPLSDEQLQEIFGTTHPTSDMVDLEEEGDLSLDQYELYDRWQAVYIILYKNGIPNVIYIEGCSGD